MIYTTKMYQKKKIYIYFLAFLYIHCCLKYNSMHNQKLFVYFLEIINLHTLVEI